ncbi:unnamed protein product [Orchesella dallaii]|uniref:Spondin domain-containing protein n=1 Tax=Orchesella dallaii TaxID=48710 RepID=A0ABP1PUF0_9HEXA
MISSAANLLRPLWIAGFVTIFAFNSLLITQVESQCSPDRLVVYHVIMKTHWSRELFPKQYPEFRPPAQWSKLVGRTHNSSYSLYRIGGMASQGLKRFAETSSSDVLDETAQGSTGVLDAFNGAPITAGVGLSETQFFVDGNHTMVSLLSRIVPSPDWFVGIDSLNLCMDQQWIDNIAVDVEPIDAGTDSGFTFTAPNWVTVPQEAIYQIHLTTLHPAHSFQYPDNRLRDKSIATFIIYKMKEYSLSQWGASRISDEGSSSSSYGSSTSNSSDPPYHHLFSDDIDSNDIGNELNEINDPKDVEDMSLRLSKKKRSRKIKGSLSRTARDCKVSDWSEWSECSALCGFGEQYRHRYVISHSRNGGALCPSLTDKRLCNSARDCRQNYFDW